VARAPADVVDNFPVVGIGASAGGLDACRKLVAALPDDSGMAYILVQHLDPNHESMMVDLLGGHTAMPVRQAINGMPLEPDHFYVIPPGTYLSVNQGTLSLTPPLARHGARLPFDFLLNSMAQECGPRAIAIILSGSGADGSLRLKAIKEKGGFVIAQDPDEAGYDGMPRSAMNTGTVDVVLRIDEIPAALASYQRKLASSLVAAGSPLDNTAKDVLPEIVDLMRAKTRHDFRLYKPGTLRRRIERRMGLASIEAGSMDRYLELLRNDGEELGLLAKDLLINVTSFFRDTKVFDLLAHEIVPDLVRRQKPDQPLRIWIAGCSTGEETYSITMLFREAITAAKSNVKLQVFASDVDPDAIASAREGTYPKRSRRTSHRNGWPGSFPRRNINIGCCPTYARWSFSRFRTCWPIRHSLVSTSYPVAIY
jgi:two-component system CheB/CheR fusion protein